MLQSVWLKKTVLTSLNGCGYPLSVSVAELRNALCGRLLALLLSEPDGKVSVGFRLSGDVFSEIPANELRTFSEAVAMAASEERPVVSEGSLFVPLSAENTSVFAYLLLSGEEPVPETGCASVSAFSRMLYSEAIGGILQSCHPVCLRTDSLCIRYGSGERITRAVDQIGFEICESELTVILGSSGCGKTSTLNAIGGMMTPASGSVQWKGREITAMNDRQRTLFRKDTVGFVFQQYNLISDLTAEENVAVSASLVRNPLPVKKVLEWVGLSEIGDRFPGEMSGGEQQRVCIARALVKRSELLLCDEPTGALDTQNALQIMRILQGLAKKSGIAVVMITHNPAFAVLADHCLTMSNGKLVDDVRQPFPLPAKHLITC